MNILISIIRIKVLALLVGTTGIGLLALYTNFQATVVILAGLGLGTSGVRDIASKNDDPALQSRVRGVLFVAGLAQGTIAMVVVWLFRVQIAQWLFGDVSRASETGLIGVAVLFSLILASQTAILQGLRRIRELGQVTVLSALSGTAFGLIAVWFMGDAGLIWFLLVQPLCGFLVAIFVSRHLVPTAPQPLIPSEFFSTWKSMANLGVVFMINGVVGSVTLLQARGLIARDLGTEALGLFSASWVISATYLGFLLVSMSADFYPRLSQIINDRTASVKLVNDQTQLGLAIGGPVLLALVGTAPWFLLVLYSSEFVRAAEMLQWLTVANVLKLGCWPMGFAFAAAGRAGIFLAIELFWNSVFLGLLWVLVPKIGLEAAGIATMITYALYFLLLNVLTGKLFAFRWEKMSLTLIAVHAILASIILALSRHSPILAAYVALALAAVTAIVGLRIVITKIGPNGQLSSRLHFAFATLKWPIKGVE